MRFRDLYQMARENLLRRKLRTCLTILSIVIGTTSIILMIALGLGMQSFVLKEFDSFGSVNVLYVSKKENASKTSRFYEKDILTGLSDSDLQALEQMKGVEFAVPLVSAAVHIVTSGFYNDVSLVGMDPYMMERLGFLTEEGRLPEDNTYEMIFGDKALEGFQELPSVNPNAVIRKPQAETEEAEDEGLTISFGETEHKEYLFDPFKERYKLEFVLPENMTGDLAVPKLFSFHGVGILKGGDMMKDNNIFIPMKTFHKLVKSFYDLQGINYKVSYSQIMVRVKELDRVDAVKKEIESGGYSVFSLSSILDSVTRTINIIKLALGVIGGISLLVAAIGITNTMVMAITERKKEIGVMKVIGATIYDIKRLFLLEAALIGLLGGVTGIAICVAITRVINANYFDKAAEQGGNGFSLAIPYYLIAAGLVFTTMIGIISGYLPALKAMRCSALEAIRNE